ncbi:GspE/PulE family protein [Cupriavidus basilensis]|uniref:GspE/PulE family protein n=1 Tax=Cupriavidus basilensis TaxID=68895 RepID=UPI0039F72304
MLNRLFGRKAPHAPLSASLAPATPAASHGRRTGAAAGGYQTAPKPVEHIDDLPPFTKKLYEEINLQASFRHYICPVETEANRFALILTENMINSDIANELIKALSFKREAAEPVYYIASTVVMVELCRDGVMENKPKTKAMASGLNSRNRNSALWSQFENIVGFAVETNASDLHFEIERLQERSKVGFRVDGKLIRPREFEIKTGDLLDTSAYLYNIHSRSGSENAFNENKPQACQIRADVADHRLLFRWASNQSAKGTKIVMRMLTQDEAQSIRTLEELGYLPDQIAAWKRTIGRLGGGTITAGVVGSGKSTTAQTIMTMLPSTMAKYTVEDPVEYIIPDTTQFSVSRSMNDTGNDPFLAVKRQLKRMDPDAVLIGEIRDHESAGLFRDIAESGHRAFSTVHAPSAIDTITMRLTSDELGIPRDVIATPGFMNLLVYQALLPINCPKCKVDHVQAKWISEAYLARIERVFGIDRKVLRFANPEGCPHCRRAGLPELHGVKGRTVVAEMIELDQTMLKMFRERQNLELKAYVRSLNRSRFYEEASTGKTVLEVSMFKVSRGEIDPREVEYKFGTFEQYEMQLASETGLRRVA